MRREKPYDARRMRVPLSGARGDAAMPAVHGRGEMAARKKARRSAKASGELIISKARTKNSVRKCNVGGEFYGALDKKVREMISSAEQRALGNKRKTLKADDL
jgi:hypothetical protein